MDQLIIPDRISQRRSINKICSHAIWGDHLVKEKLKTRKDVLHFFLSRNINPNDIASKCRDYKQPIPFFKNLLTSTWKVKGGGVAVVDSEDGEVISEISSDGVIHLSTYEEIFRSACQSQDRAIENNSYTEFLTAITLGLASIESFINFRVHKWNKKNPQNQLIDNKSNKVSLSDKITEWTPIMTNQTFPKGDKWWTDFVYLRKIRDDQIIHTKNHGISIEYKKLAKDLNKFRTGIAEMLGRLHLFFGQGVPPVVLNAIYIPSIKVQVIQ